MSNLKTLGLAAVCVVMILLLTPLHLSALVQNLFSWGCAAAMLACAVI